MGPPPSREWLVPSETKLCQGSHMKMDWLVVPIPALFISKRLCFNVSLQFIFSAVSMFLKWNFSLPSGNLLHNYGKSPFLMGKIHYKWPFSIAMLNYSLFLCSRFFLRNLPCHQPQATSYVVEDSRSQRSLAGDGGYYSSSAECRGILHPLLKFVGVSFKLT